MFARTYFGGSYFGPRYFGGVGAVIVLPTIKDLRRVLRQYILDAPDIAAIVGDRMFPVVLPQGITSPSIVYTKISDVGDHHMQGPSGLARPRFQIDAWAPDADTADEVARLVKARLDGFSGTLDGLKVQAALFDTWREDYDSEAELFRTSADYMIWFEER